MSSELVPKTPASQLASSPLKRENLLRTIFAAESPESIVRALPAQAIYMAVQHAGLSSSSDLINIIPQEQFRLMLDFDLWEKDCLSEGQFWQWLELTDAEGDLGILQKFLKCIDLKLVALMMGRYLDIVTVTEATEKPPGPAFYTPDKGFTWIQIKTEDGHRHFLFARFLALVFETSAELFYQLLAVSANETVSVLEETAYQDARKRLESEGVPAMEFAAEIHRPLPREKAMEAIRQGVAHQVLDIPAVPPLALAIQVASDSPFAALQRAVGSTEEFQAEFTLIANAALVYFSTTFNRDTEVLEVVEKVVGALDIGLALCGKEHNSSEQIYRALGLRGIYQVAWARLLQLRKNATRVFGKRDDAIALLFKNSITQPFPIYPIALDDPNFPAGTITTGTRSLSTIEELIRAESVIASEQRPE